MQALEIAVILVLIVLNGVFAMAELALVSARRSRLEQLAAEGRGGAQVALLLSADPGRFLAAVQIGVTLTAILSGALGGAVVADPLEERLSEWPLVAPYARPAAIGLVVVVLTYLTLIVGELVPKQIALKYPEAIAARVARPIAFIARMVAPLVWLLNTSSAFILRLFGLRPGFDRPVTEEEIHSLIAEGEKSGAIHAVERDMIEGVLDLADSAIRTIMTTRPDVLWVDLDEPSEVTMRKIRESPHGQLLVCRGSIDDVVGMVRKQDLLDQIIDRKTPPDVESVVHAPLVVPEGTSILKTLSLFRAAPVHAAVVVDEYGSVQGIVTRTDLLEAVAGDLPSIGDKSEPDVTKRDDGSFLIDATTPMPEVAALLGLRDLPEGDFLTLAGFMLYQLDRVPRPAEHFSWGGWRFQVVSMDGRRIDKVLVQPVRNPEPSRQPSGSGLDAS